MHYDFIIIGNGILGYALAFEIAKKAPKMKIAVIGPKTRSGAAAKAAGAMLSAFSEVTNKTLSSEPGKIKFDMAVQASKLWPLWLDSINSYLPKEKHIEIQKGTYIIANTKSGSLEDENYNSIINALNLYKEPYELNQESKISGVNPSEAGRFTKSLYLPQEGSISTEDVLEALHYILINCLNVTIFDDNVTKLNSQAYKVTGIETLSGEKYYSEQIILAAGAFSQQLINQVHDIKHKIPLILSGVGYSVLIKQISTDPIKQVVRTPNRAGACGLHVVPRNKDILYIGATNNVFLTPTHLPTMGLLNFLFQCATEQINQEFYKSEILDWYVGNRPATLDTFPLIGETSLTGLWLLTGTYRDGFHQSPLLAENLAKSILGQSHNLPELFKPERSLIQTRTRDESILEFLEHYIAGTYEHSAKLPSFMTDKDFLSLIKPRVEYWYEKMDTDFNFSADMLLMFNFSNNLEEQLAQFKNYFKTQSIQNNFRQVSKVDPVLINIHQKISKENYFSN